jgi:hypothetical protein
VEDLVAGKVTNPKSPEGDRDTRLGFGVSVDHLDGPNP